MVNLDYLGKQLFCLSCKSPLFLTAIEGETLMGIHSVLHVKCSSCSMLRTVHTGNCDKVNEDARKFLPDKQHSDITTQAVLGTV